MSHTLRDTAHVRFDGNAVGWVFHYDLVDVRARYEGETTRRRDGAAETVAAL